MGLRERTFVRCLLSGRYPADKFLPLSQTYIPGEAVLGRLPPLRWAALGGAGEAVDGSDFPEDFPVSIGDPVLHWNPWGLELGEQGWMCWQRWTSPGLGLPGRMGWAWGADAEDPGVLGAHNYCCLCAPAFFCVPGPFIPPWESLTNFCVYLRQLWPKPSSKQTRVRMAKMPLVGLVLVWISWFVFSNISQWLHIKINSSINFSIISAFKLLVL